MNANFMKPEIQRGKEPQTGGLAKEAKAAKEGQNAWPSLLRFLRETMFRFGRD